MWSLFSSGARPKSKSNLAAADNVAVPDEAFMTEYKDFSLQKTISGIEGKLEKENYAEEDLDDDIMPSAAAEMGAGTDPKPWSYQNHSCNISPIFYAFVNYLFSEAQMRFLKAKLRVMQEELDRLTLELNTKVC